MIEDDIRLMRIAIDAARHARTNGNSPFGAVLADAQHNVLLESENTVVTARDCTGHAETNLMRKASAIFDPDFLATCTVYTSTEPCPMCAGAIFFGNVRRVVFGLSAAELYELIGESSDNVLNVPCCELFDRGKKSINVVGPILEDEARDVHRDFWNRVV